MSSRAYFATTSSSSLSFPGRRDAEASGCRRGLRYVDRAVQVAAHGEIDSVEADVVLHHVAQRGEGQAAALAHHSHRRGEEIGGGIADRDDDLVGAAPPGQFLHEWRGLLDRGDGGVAPSSARSRFISIRSAMTLAAPAIATPQTALTPMPPVPPRPRCRRRRHRRHQAADPQPVAACTSTAKRFEGVPVADGDDEFSWTTAYSEKVPMPDIAFTG